ncbi:disintegrin and metalloproteinase domain-containing protein 28-like isoform X2 [Stegodyphus dumicola]|nr:disintegrin and metalloproteinase domain-containing protein 28-like isoform X2 [Stegodyphus dumicola]
MLRNKYIETALVLDQTLIEEFKSPPEDIAAAALEIINYVNLLFQPLNTYVSLVYLELWEEDQMKFDTVMNETLSDFQDYTARKINRISVDAAHLLTGFKFDSDKNGLAFIDSICTANAAGLTRVDNHFQPHITSFILAHSIGHNLGMSHDQAHCKCSNYSACVMTNDVPLLSSAFFSNCSVGEFYQTLSKGYGACLFNMPTMRMSVCGNRITEEPEECDCGTVEECATENPCCDPMTCKLIKHAQCSSGPCCRKCKLLSPDHLCRSSKGECDIAEFCDGKSGECPEDLYKKNGAMCSDGNGYCFQGACPVLKEQCQEIWGQNADVADSVCFKRLNVLGTPYGNCGSDSDDQIHKCTVENSLCGLIQCSKGEVSTSDETLPIEYVVHKMNSQGRIHECKVRIFGSKDFKRNLVKDGTKCGYWKLCVNQTCTSVKDIVSGNCPSVDPELMCSGHGVCTNINTCVCDEGWKGLECNIVDEENKWRTTNEDSEYYDSIQESNMKPSYKGRNELNLHPNLVIIVIAASITIGLSLLLILFLFIIYRKL